MGLCWTCATDSGLTQNAANQTESVLYTATSVWIPAPRMSHPGHNMNSNELPHTTHYYSYAVTLVAHGHMALRHTHMCHTLAKGFPLGNLLAIFLSIKTSSYNFGAALS